MRFYQIILILLCACLLSACGENPKPEAPLDTLKAYNQAVKEKDTATIKSLLSSGSIKMAQDEARAQNVSADEILQRETLYSPGQTTVKIRNQNIEGDQARIEVENSSGIWEIVFFVKENGKWKIAKERYEEEMLKQAEEADRRIDEQINRDKKP